MKRIRYYTGATGKSTLFKSLQIIHDGEIKQAEREFTRQIIRQNVVIGITTLVAQANVLYAYDTNKYVKCELESDSKIEDAVTLLNKYQNKSAFGIEEEIDWAELKLLSNAVEMLWQLEPIKETARNHGTFFAFDDNLEYFFANVHNIMNEKYLPTDEECLKNRAKTSGIFMYLSKKKQK